ncbi:MULTISPECIES: zinc ribbon domain-containing protein YjdM [Eikenella]|uniref:Alkylphosphonate utilization protein n=1 Tax=Eikenella longinqua TaxID=1795827 RepID=A0A1A9RWK2_9NEIS|nr:MULTISPECIES: zinc ribbon domain-containing protein YjdM [Eikenella]OAM26791.1 alkylphosphonate utilization protein [Eikenella longinqua]
MSTLPPCPQCQSEYVYQDGDNLICPECAHEWPAQAAEAAEGEAGLAVTDAHGAPLANGDSVVLLKDLKVKGSSLVVKQGTKVKNIRLQEGDHAIACKVNGTALNLKAEFVKKA